MCYQFCTSCRLTVDEEGCARILNIRCSRKIFLHLIDGLICDKPNRAMNAAFALGRLFQLESGQRNLLKMKQADNMVLFVCTLFNFCVNPVPFAYFLIIAPIWISGSSVVVSRFS